MVIGEAPPGLSRTMSRSAGARAATASSWLGRLDHHDPLLASAYAAARVFALPSWFETPGLAALEAALAGCSDRDHALRLDPGVLRRPGGVCSARTGPRRSGGPSAKCWDDGPDPRLSRSDRDSISLAERGPDHRGGL